MTYWPFIFSMFWFSLPLNFLKKKKTENDSTLTLNTIDIGSKEDSKLPEKKIKKWKQH